MSKLISGHMKDQRGMTLIEILIVMALIAGLMTVLVSQVMPRFGQAEIKETRLKMQNLANALEMYRTDCQKYPNELSNLLTKPDACKNWTSPYMKNEADFQDVWGNEFVYENKDSSFLLKSYGKDGAEGGDGVKADFIFDGP